MVHKQAQPDDGRQCFAWCFLVRLLFRRGSEGADNEGVPFQFRCSD